MGSLWPATQILRVTGLPRTDSPGGSNQPCQASMCAASWALLSPRSGPPRQPCPIRSICQLGPCQVSTTALSGSSGRARLALFSCWASSSRCNRVITISTTTMITLFQPLRLSLNMTSLP